MTYQKNYARMFILSFLIIFSACQKRNTMPGNSVTTATTKKLIRVGDSTNNTQFQYDAAFNVTGLNMVTDSNSNIYTVSYINGIAAKVQGQYYSSTLSYTEGHLFRRQTFNNTTSAIESMELFNYTNGNISEEIYYEQPLPSTILQPQLKFEFETLPNGDITKASIYLWDPNTNQFTYQGRNEYQYDTHANPIYPLKDYYNIFITFPATPHNVMTENTYDFSGALISVVNYSYTYDAAGDPVAAKRIYTPTGRPQQISGVTYTYQ